MMVIPVGARLNKSPIYCLLLFRIYDDTHRFGGNLDPYGWGLTGMAYQ